MIDSTESLELDEAQPVSVTEVRGPRGRHLRVIREWREALATIRDGEDVAWDLETGGLNPWTAPIAVLSLHAKDSDALCVLHFNGYVPDEVIEFLESPRLWVGHNTTNFDRLFLEQYGADTFRDGVKHYDTLVGEAVAKVSGRRDVRVNLQATLARRLGKKIIKEADHHSWITDELSPKQVAYCVDDVYSLHRLRAKQIADCSTDTRLRALEVEQELTSVVCAMILTGLPIDHEALGAWHAGSQGRIDKAYAAMQAAVGDILFTSPVQVKRGIADAFGVELESTRNEVLEALGQQDTPLGAFCRDLQLYRQGTKRTGMYDRDWITQYVQADGRMHGRFWQVGTETGRFSSSDPNLQQWPRDGRGVVGGADGMLVVQADYDSIEVVIAAGLANDEVLLGDCEGDPHLNLAVATTGLPPDQVTKEQRRLAKAGNFTFLFCGGVRRFHEAAVAGGSHMSLPEARKLMDDYLNRYRGIKRMREVAFKQAERGIVELRFPTGLRRQLAGAEVTPTRIVNNTVQGTAAAGMKYAMLELNRRGMVRGYLGASVHDELVAVVPENYAEEYKCQLVESMVSGMRQAISSIPIRASAKIATHWS